MFRIAAKRLGIKTNFRNAGRFLSTVKPSASNSSSRLAIGSSIGLIGLYMISNQYSLTNEIDQEKLKEARQSAFEKVQKESSSKLGSKKDQLNDGVREVVDDLEEKLEEGGESEDKSQQAAYNPETGEINWDCPCLGGMAQGPCGEEFKEAFSCFVYSEAEPKGIDCITKFETMRSCFRKYPEHYKEELYDDDEPISESSESSQDNSASDKVEHTEQKTEQTEQKSEQKDEKKESQSNDNDSSKEEKTQAAIEQVQTDSETKKHTDENTVEESD